MLREVVGHPYQSVPPDSDYPYQSPSRSHGYSGGGSYMNGGTVTFFPEESGASRGFLEQHGIRRSPSPTAIDIDKGYRYPHHENGYGNSGKLVLNGVGGSPQLEVGERRSLPSFNSFNGNGNFNNIANPDLHGLHNHNHHHQMMAKNVHFSPVVSKLRYPPAVDNLLQGHHNYNHDYNQHHYHHPNSPAAPIPKCIRESDMKSPFYFNDQSRIRDNGDNGVIGDLHDNHLYSTGSGSGGDEQIHRVKVHMEQFDKPVQVQHYNMQKVQKVQVRVPQQNGLGTEKFALDLIEEAPPYYPGPTNGIGGHGHRHPNSNELLDTDTTDHCRNRKSEPISLFANKFSSDENEDPDIDNRNRLSSYNSPITNTNDMRFQLRNHHRGDHDLSERLKTRRDLPSYLNGFGIDDQASSCTIPLPPTSEPEPEDILPQPSNDAVSGSSNGHGRLFSAFGVTTSLVASPASPSTSTSMSCASCRHDLEACRCIMRGVPPTPKNAAPAEECAMNTPIKINQPSSSTYAAAYNTLPATLIPKRNVDVDEFQFTSSWRGTGPADDDKNLKNFGESENSGARVYPPPPLTRNINSVGSLECFEPEEHEGVGVVSPQSNFGGDDKENQDLLRSDKSRGDSWPNAYRNRKLKDKSDKPKPKLSFLQRLTFGRFGGGGGTGGGSNNKADNNKSSAKSSKAQKRSSCPPLGHPLLQISINGGSGVDGDLSFGGGGVGDGDGDSKFMNDLSIGDNHALVGSVTDNCGGALLDEQLIEDPDPDKDLRKPGYSINNFSSDLPPKPSPRQKKHNNKLQDQHKNSLGCDRRKGGANFVPSDPDELSVKFEQILEGIFGLEFDDSIPIMEEKEIGDGNNGDDDGGNWTPTKMNSPYQNQPLTRIDEGDNGDRIHRSMGIMETGAEDKASNSTVVGKPPKPPNSARQIGMRTGASERFSYLKGRMNATAATETRLAMELAAKLCEFREELHRSREEIAKSHPDLDEIENSVRISLAIDRARRTLPQSRNCTGVPLTLPPNTTSGSSITTTASRSSSSSTSSTTATTKEKAAAVKPVTEIIKEEWESVVLRAKESLRPSYNHQQLLREEVPSNNGKSGDPCHSRATVLETDLDTGASRGIPVGINSFNYGDTARRRDLEKVLIFEDFTPSSPLVPKSSCSLQNLSSCGVLTPDVMATLKPGDPGGGGGGSSGSKEDRSRSMEFLVDDKNAHLRPPENTLMKNQETRRMSEHELRIQRSLQKLNVPDWYKNYAPSGTVSAAGTPSKSRDFGSGSGLAGGWPGLSTSKTNSLTSLQSAGRYAGSKSQFGYGRNRSTGTASAGGRSSRESLMSPSSTASASPSPNFERSSFTYGMPYALTRFAAARMSCGASPASLSPSPSPVGGIGSSTSTPSGPGPTARYGGYQKQPYLGWRSQERLNQKSLYRSPAERLAADLIAQKKPPPPPELPRVEHPPPPEIEITERISPKKEIATSDLSLNNSEESNSHKLNRVRSSIKEVSNAIVDYVNETKPLDDGINGRASPRRGLVWLESSFVGTKPLDSPGTPDTPSTFMSQRGSRKEPAFRFDDTPSDKNKDIEVKSGESSSTSHYTSYISRNEQMEERSSSSVSSPTLEDILDSLLALRRPNKKFRSKGQGHESITKFGADTVGGGELDSYNLGSAATTSTTSPTAASTTYSRTSTTTTNYPYPPEPPTYKASTTTSTYHQYQYEPSTTSEIYSTPTRSINKYSSSSYQSQSPTSGAGSTSDWQDRMNQPLADSAFMSGEPETFTLTGGRTIGASGEPPIISSSSYVSGSNLNNDSSSIERPQMSRYSTSAGASTPPTGVNESIGGYSSYVGGGGGTTHSASSSVHSTPTHQTYQYKSSSYNQSSSSPSSAVASSKDYYSSPSSSPAKGCLVDPSQRDDNELRQSLLRGGIGGGAGGDDEDELAFGNPTEIRSTSTVTSSTVAPITGSVVVNPLTGLSEYSNPPTPARHRRVSFDLDFSDKEEKSSSRSRNKDENVGGTIQCKNTKCGKTATGLEARREFKVCHNCNAYYCSRECRRAHWEKHKKTCMQSRVGAICKQIISHVKEDSYVMNQLSTVAKRGFLAKGRGSVKLFFNSPDRAERFLTGGLPELPEPLYIPHSDMLPEEMGTQTFSELSEQCKSYNPDTRFVLYACVCVVNEVPTYGAVKWERELISRSSKLRLLLPRNFYEENQRHHHAPASPAHLMQSALHETANGRILPPTPPSSAGLQQPQQPNVPLYDRVTPSSTAGEDFPPPPPPHQRTTMASAPVTTTTTSSENETLILRSVPPPSSHQLTPSEHKRLREVSFTNIQKHLLLRGVDLKRSYPDIFTKLCKYVEHDEPFLPVTIYPKNSQTGRQFVCIIMPESSDSAYTAAAEETGQRQPLHRVETVNISEQDEDEFLDIT